jgi:queuine tRNA-ribosyltransferase
VCRKYSKAFLQHLFKVGDSAAMRLATIHNLRFYSRLMEKLGEAL